MNICVFIGRIATEPELKRTASGIANCSFRLAVKRRFKDSSGEYQTDFINIVAWRQAAEYITAYLHKGDMAAVQGSLQNRSYEAQDGTKRYVTEIICDQVQPCGNPGRVDNSMAQSTPEANADANRANAAGFVEVTDDELPF